jgi:hypothetical protein
MSCKQCISNNLRPFNGEIALHFPGLNGLDQPIVWVFPQLVVCLDCGLAQFFVPERELGVLAEGSPAASEPKPAEISEHLRRMAKPA